MSRRPEWIAVGRITRAHGVKGEVAVLPLSEVSSRFDPGAVVYMDESEQSPLEVRAVRQHRDRLLVEFEGVLDRTQAEALHGRYLFVQASTAPDLPEGEFWTHQLVGAEVVTEGGLSLGTIREIIHTQANDVWVAQGDAGEVLVPALKDVVASVDVEGERVVVREIPGLTAP